MQIYFVRFAFHLSFETFSAYYKSPSSFRRTTSFVYCGYIAWYEIRHHDELG